MKNIRKLLNVVAVFAVFLLHAQIPPNPGDTPPGGQGGNGTGYQSIPIDMYVYVLAIAAVLMIVYFAKKYKTQKI